MATNNRTKRPSLRLIHTCAIGVALVCGSYALVALVTGSPLEFGIALALCGVGWVAAHYIEWGVEHDRRACPRVQPARVVNADHWSTHAVFVSTRSHGPRVITRPSSTQPRYCFAPGRARVLHGSTRGMSA
jgi:hypothetical protein